MGWPDRGEGDRLAAPEEEDCRVRLSEWPRNPYLNDELRQWVALHLGALGVEDLAVFATASGREDDERRILVATEVGLLDGWYAPSGSTARYSLTLRLHPWQAVRGVDLRAETFRLWAHEHQSRWWLRIGRPPLDVVADTPELGRALAHFAGACSVMAETSGQAEIGGAEPERRAPEQPFPAPSVPMPSAAPPERPEVERMLESHPYADEGAALAARPISIEPVETQAAEELPEEQPLLEIQRRLGLR